MLCNKLSFIISGREDKENSISRSQNFSTRRNHMPWTKLSVTLNDLCTKSRQSSLCADSIETLSTFWYNQILLEWPLNQDIANFVHTNNTLLVLYMWAYVHNLFEMLPKFSQSEAIRISTLEKQQARAGWIMFEAGGEGSWAQSLTGLEFCNGKPLGNF